MKAGPVVIASRARQFSEGSVWPESYRARRGRREAAVERTGITGDAIGRKAAAMTIELV